MRSMLVTTMLLVGCLAGSGIGRAEGRPFLPVGVFIAPIEEGARIFTPVRLLPFDHPEAAGHEFPNALQLHGTEFDALVLLGRHAGLGLAATLQRYPRQPDAAWPYPGFDQPPLEALRNAAVVRRPMAEAPATKEPRTNKLTESVGRTSKSVLEYRTDSEIRPTRKRTVCL